MCHTSLQQRALFLLWLIISLAEILAEIKGKKKQFTVHCQGVKDHWSKALN